MEAAIRSVQVGSGQQASSQQPQSEISGSRGQATTGPPHPLPPHSMPYNQPRGGAGGISEVHRSSATNSNSPYPQYHPMSYDPSRGRVRPQTTFSTAPTTGKSSYSWQPTNTQYEYSPRTSLHQPTLGTVPSSFVNASFHAGFPRVSIPQPQQQQPPTQNQQSVPNAPTHTQLLGSEYITSSSSIRDSASAARLQTQQQQGQRQSQTQQTAPPDPGGQQQQMQQQSTQQPAYKKIRLGEPYHQQPQTNSLHHPAATPMPVRLHHHSSSNIQPNNNPVVVHVAPPLQRQLPNPTSGATADIQYQPQQKPQTQQQQQQNGPPSNVRDAMLDFIERSLKNATVPPKPSQVPPLKPNPPVTIQPPSTPVDNNPDITFVGAYRQEGANKIQIQPQRRTNAETLATLSIVNSNSSGQQSNVPNQPQIIAGHPLNISSIAATITPVPPPQQNQRPSSNPIQEKDNGTMKVFPGGRGVMSQPSSIVNQSEPEPQTLDLSIKKPQQQQQQQPQERQFTSFAKAVPPPPSGSVYRGDPSLQPQPNIPNQSTFLAFHPEMSRHPSKSPSTYIPPSLSPGQRVLTMNPHLQQQQQQQQQQQIVGKGNKNAPKLSSPKVHHQQPGQQGNVQQINGPKGSITLGTPLTDNRGQPIMIQGTTTQSPRYDYPRQTPPSANDNKFGSITAGTPIHLSDKRVHDYMKNSRHSPATNQPNVSVAGSGNPPHPSQQQFTSPYRPSPHSSELNSTQALIFSDYLTSQQMQGHNQSSRGGGGSGSGGNTVNIITGVGAPPSGRSEKESPSPRSMAHSNSPAAIYYGDKDRERAGSGQPRPEYLSRSSPADHHNSTPSPHRTPPPQQRQGVIQRHNTGGSKPPSPAPSRLTQQGHYAHHYVQGHDAFSNLVDVAVAQPSLPVPNDNNSRRTHITVSSADGQPQSLAPHRERYQTYLHPADVAAIQQQHQIEMFRRQHHNREIQEYNERKEREFHQERERERERERDEAQRRLDADMAQRNFERERLEQARLPYSQSTWRPGPSGRMPEESIPFTAQCLINAIITENISRPPEPRERFVSNSMRQANGTNSRMDSLWLQANRDQISRLQAENNGNSHSPNVINVDVDSNDLSRHSQSSSSLPQKNIKLNDITDAVIAKDPAFGHLQHHQPPPGAYLPSGQHFVRYSNASSIPNKTPPSAQSHATQSNQPQQPQQIIATDQWKLNRRLQQQQQKEEMAKGGNNGGGPQGRSTPDDRHIIRMAQSPSPRTKMSYEPVSPPETAPHYYLQSKPMITINANDQRKLPPGVVPTSQENAPTGDATMVLKFVNHRIAEAMRNDDKYGSNEHHSVDGKDGHSMKSYERPRSGSSIPGNGIPENDNEKSSIGKRESPSVYISHSTRPSPQPNQPFQASSMSFMYPYSALTIPPSGPNPIISPKAANELIDSNRQSSGAQSHMETRQVLSEQYDALSDED
ncbi:CLUMA_CG016988, isoform B [Clunio marinus]|uniref:CLUMA_CG016988, isoform B n=1 Tax=Clunio marinus TaxID=568069 RepID=A0A1J1IWA7_9DIPT|nr:CLUMA_CG016988, isoform B [Clunio marinus]